RPYRHVQPMEKPPAAGLRHDGDPDRRSGRSETHDQRVDDEQPEVVRPAGTPCEHAPAPRNQGFPERDRQKHAEEDSQANQPFGRQRGHEQKPPRSRLGRRDAGNARGYNLNGLAYHSIVLSTVKPSPLVRGSQGAGAQAKRAIDRGSRKSGETAARYTLA